MSRKKLASAALQQSAQRIVSAMAVEIDRAQLIAARDRLLNDGQGQMGKPMPTVRDKIFNQADADTAQSMLRAIDEIDGAFGVGYAKNNPGLVSGYLVAAAHRNAALTRSRMLATDLRDLSDLLASAIAAKK